MLHNPEYRLKSSSGQDRSANRRSARTTDKGCENRRIYSLLSRYNKTKRELTQRQYVQLSHDEVEVAFEAVHFHSAYGKIPVVADRSCQAQTAWALTLSSWKLRSAGKAPHILTYGMEGLEGLRVGNSDALEIRLGWYGNLICSAPGFNMQVALSA